MLAAHPRLGLLDAPACPDEPDYRKSDKLQQMKRSCCPRAHVRQAMTLDLPQDAKLVKDALD